jgi:SAM-dependent methyltransferase
MKIGTKFSINGHQNYLYSGPVKKSWHFFNRHANSMALKNGHLDVGCGSGFYLIAIAAQRGIGVDLDNEALSKVPKDFLTYNCSLIDLDETIADVGLISLFEVLEHTEDPNLILANIKNRLCKEGVLIGSTPNSERLWAKLFGYEAFDYPPNHLHRFSKKDIESMLIECGFTNIEVKAAFILPSLSDVIYRAKILVNGMKFFSWLIVPLIYPMIVLMNLTRRGYLHHGFIARR